MSDIGKILISGGRWVVPAEERPRGWKTQWPNVAEPEPTPEPTPILDTIIESASAAQTQNETLEECWIELVCAIRKNAFGTWGATQDIYHAALVLAGPLFAGSFDPSAIAKLTGLSKIDVDRFGQRYLDTGIWKMNEYVNLGGSGDDELPGDLDWILRSMVGVGELDWNADDETFYIAKDAA